MEYKGFWAKSSPSMRKVLSSEYTRKFDTVYRDNTVGQAYRGELLFKTKKIFFCIKVEWEKRTISSYDAGSDPLKQRPVLKITNMLLIHR